MSDTIFNADPTATPPAPAAVPSPAPVVPVVPQELTELVGEGKKYKTVEDALKSVPHAQTHIQRLEQEAENLRQELAKRKAAADLLEELKQSGITQVPPTATPAVFDQDKLVQIVSQTLEQREAQRTAEQNVNQVVQSFVQKFGDTAKANEAYVKLAQDTGLPVAELNKLAARSPSAVLKLAGFGAATPPPVGKPSNGVNTEALRQVPPTTEQSARVTGGSTKDLVSAWRIAGEKVKNKQTQ